MGSSVKKMAVFMMIFMVVAVAGIVIYANRDSFKDTKETAALTEAEEAAPEDGETKQIGSDTRAFLNDETFFDPEEEPYSSIEVVEGTNLSLLMTSVQKDLRIQIVDNAGELVTGESFCVVLNGEQEYTDDDQNGMIYIDELRAGNYGVMLKETEGYMVPETPTQITVKQNIEYAVIDDISRLIFTEDDVDPEVEDLEVNEAREEADKTEITKQQMGNANAKLGIDVSKWNKEIDWDKVREDGVEYAIIRVGYRGATTGALIQDPYFEKNIKGAISAGLPVGIYFFTQAVNPVEAVEEASMVITMCENYDITYPVFIDTEGAGGNGRADGLDTEMRTQVCAAFLKTIENAGYRGGVYASRNWFGEKLNMDELDDYVVWLAEYRDVPQYKGYYHMWQYTSKGSIDGIEGNVDLNLSYLKLDKKTNESADTSKKGNTDDTDAEESSGKKQQFGKNNTSGKNNSSTTGGKSNTGGSNYYDNTDAEDGGSSGGNRYQDNTYAEDSGGSGGNRYPDNTYSQESGRLDDTYAQESSYIDNTYAQD